MKSIVVFVFFVGCVAKAFSMDVADGLHQQGADLFLQRCAICHGNNAMGEGVIPIKLKDYPSTNLLINTRYDSLPEIKSAIYSGIAGKDLVRYMPPWSDELESTEIDLLASFVVYLRQNTNEAVSLLLESKKDHATNAGYGRSVFESRCVLCHGTEGGGDGRLSKIITSPPPSNLQLSVATLEYIELIVEKGGPGVGRSAQMPPWGDQLTKSEVNAVAKYIFSLRKKE